MKTLSAAVMLLVSSAVGVYAQAGVAKAQKPGKLKDTDYSATEVGAHHRVWERTTYETAADGSQVPQVHRYTELATGLHYQNTKGQWLEAKEEFELLPGKAVARQGQHRVSLNYNLNSAGAIEMETPDGKELKSHVVGLSYFDSSSGESVLIAEVKDSAGKVSGNQVIYEDAFTDFQADVRYTYTKAGFEQDIILREQPPTPEDYGLNPETTKLQVLTEFVSAPPVRKQARALMRRDGKAVADEDLEFGAMQMGRGKAFSLGRENTEIPVGKQWLKLDGREFLVEEVAVPDLQEELQALPAAAESASVKPASGTVRHQVSRRRLLPEPRLAQAGKGEMKVAALTTPRQGLVLDYVTLNSIMTNYTFRGDTTYYISGSVYLFGTNTFEGGAVIKYTNNAAIGLVSAYGLGAKFNWLATAYRPVVFTAKDDDSVGEMIPGSTHSPAGYYANPALGLWGVPSQSLSYVRFAYAKQGMGLGGSMPTVSHAQFVNCERGVVFSGAGIVLRNALFANTRTNFDISSGAGIYVQQTTFSGSGFLVTVPGYPCLTMTMTNCILANVTNLYNANPGSFTGGFNGFYNSPGFGAVQFNSPAYPFQTVGAGNHYLTNGCVFRDVGTTNIDSTILADLRKKTTYPPANPPTFSPWMPTTWVITAARDNDGRPDLGYHYDPLDYWVSQYVIGGYPHTLTNGVAVGCYGASAFTINGGAGFNSQGRADSMNHLVWYPAVQEQPVKINGISTAGSRTFTFGGSPSILNFQFTDMPMQGLRQTLFYANVPRQMPRVTFQDCQFRGATMIATRDLVSVSPVAIVMLRNCLLERCSLELYFGTALDYTVYYQNPLGVTLLNNLFWNCSVGLAYYEAQDQYHYAPTIKDNLFDTSTINLSGNGNYLAYVYRSNNGYFNTTPGLLSDPNIPTTDVSLGDLTYAGGSPGLGPWYIGSASPPLTDAGSRPADSAGLYHYTTQADAYSKEYNSTVDIGFHYVATDSSGNPVDSDGDGMPDYLEDANGNGVVNSGETDWQSATDLGLKVIITRPRNSNKLP